SFNPFCGLTSAQGNRDGAHFQGTSAQDQAVLNRVHAASLLNDQQLKDLAAGKSVTIPSNQLQYLYEFAQSFDGKSPTEIAAIKAGLPEESQDAMTRAFDLVSNNQVKSGVPFTDGALKNFIPDLGSEPRLPHGIVSETIELPPLEPTDAEKFLRAVNQQYGDEPSRKEA
ncbi:TPR repeat region-containing protein, partial [Mycobacteroides abscessus]